MKIKQRFETRVVIYDRFKQHDDVSDHSCASRLNQLDVTPVVNGNIIACLCDAGFVAAGALKYSVI